MDRRGDDVPVAESAFAVEPDTDGTELRLESDDAPREIVAFDVDAYELAFADTIFIEVSEWLHDDVQPLPAQRIGIRHQKSA